MPVVTSCVITAEPVKVPGWSGSMPAPGRFAQKPVPPGTIRLGRFAQNFERVSSHNITGTVRSKLNLLEQFTLFNFQKEKKKKKKKTFEVEF